MIEKIGRWLDAAGVTASWLCALHCLALPFLIGALPLAGLSFLLDETTERVFIAISALLAALSLVPAYFREHGKLRSIFLALAGIGLILLTHFLFEDELILKFVFLLAGGGLISAAHILNRRLCRECAVCAAA
jgi:predicted membrane channel-forming protein YqfA (hemolysin III family)